MEKYITAKENEASSTNVHRIAQEARARLKERLSGTLGARARSELEAKIKQEVFQTFDYGEAERSLKDAKHKSRQVESDINALLADLRQMCQMAMNPDMRERKTGSGVTTDSTFPDVFVLARGGLKKHP